MVSARFCQGQVKFEIGIKKTRHIVAAATDSPDASWIC